MANAKDSIYISNTSQGTVSINCSFIHPDTGEIVPVYHDIPPARECIGVKVPLEDWNRVKKTDIIARYISAGILLPEKKKVTIDQETWKASIPEPTGELKEASLDNLVLGAEPVTIIGSRKGRTRLK